MEDVGTVWAECGRFGKVWEKVWENVLGYKGRCKKVCWDEGGGKKRCGERCGDCMRRVWEK